MTLKPEVKNSAGCLAALLPEIRLPRELYFLGKSKPEVAQECYSASFSSSKLKILNSELITRRLKVEIPFPLSRKLKTENDLKTWLIVTTLNLMSLADADQQIIRADVVPDSLCSQCFKQDPLFSDKKSGKLPSVFWKSMVRE